MLVRPALVVMALCAAPAMPVQRLAAQSPGVQPTAASPAAQSAAEHIALGDREHLAMNAQAAYKHYQAAVAADSANYEALWKASREAIDLSEFTKDKAPREALYRAGTQYARRAVAANPRDAEGHFHLARSLGRTAQSLGTRERIKYAGDVRAQALEALKLNPKHPGALHVMGVWNAEVMRLSGISRFMAKNFLGGKVFGSANWKDAVRYMEEAVAVEPDRIVHRLDLAKIYSDVGNKAKARSELEQATRMPARDYNDPSYKRQAEELLKTL